MRRPPQVRAGRNTARHHRFHCAPRRAPVADAASPGHSGGRRPRPAARRPDRGRAHQRPVGAQAGRDDPGRPGEVEPRLGARSPLGRHRRRGARSRGRPNRPPRPAPSPTDWPPRPPPGRPGFPARRRTESGASDAGRPVIGLDRQPRRLGLEAAATATHTWPAVRLDHHVADVPGIPLGTVEQAAVEHDPPPDAGRHHHGQIVVAPPGRSEPPFRQRQRLGVVVHRRPAIPTSPARRRRRGKP